MTPAEMIEGLRFEVKVDPADPRFEIITYRMVRNEVVGGPSTPLCALEGDAARLRWMRFILGRAAGLLLGQVPDKVIQQICRVHDTYVDKN